MPRPTKYWMKIKMGMKLKKDLDDFHRNILILLELVNEDKYFRSLVEKNTIAEYEYIESQIRHFRENLDKMSEHDKRLLELNVALNMLAYHVNEYAREIESGKIPNKKILAAMFQARTKLIAQIKDEYFHRLREKVSKTDTELTMFLTEYARMVFEAKFAKAYKQINHNRPFFDKFYRDYSFLGIPTKLLSELVSVARQDSYDMYICVLKSGLSFTIMLELLGIPNRKIKHVISGRKYEGSDMGQRIFQPVDFELSQLTGKKILIVDHNLGTGKSVKMIIDGLKEFGPKSI